jgi:hypothetical protein
LVKRGIHPAHEQQQVKQRNLEVLEERNHAWESSFAKVTKAYLAEVKPIFALSSYRTRESRIRKSLSPKFDGMPMSDIGVKQIRPMLEECKAHGAWAGIHVKGDLSAIFEFAVVRGLMEANPIPSLRGLLRMPVLGRVVAPCVPFPCVCIILDNIAMKQQDLEPTRNRLKTTK